MINHKPIGYRVLIIPDQVEEISPGGIHIVKDAVKQEQLAQVKGIVKAIGKDAFSDSEDKIKAGDVVLYQRYSGMKIPNDDGTFRDDLLLLNDRDITCIIENIPDEE